MYIYIIYRTYGTYPINDSNTRRRFSYDILAATALIYLQLSHVMREFLHLFASLRRIIHHSSEIHARIVFADGIQLSLQIIKTRR